MAGKYFKFKQFTVFHDRSAFKVGTDGVLLGACADVDGKENILDIGTGTGLIALMMAQRCSAAIYAIEPDHDSFLQASENVKLSRWHQRITVENCNLQSYFPGDLKFDLIVTNPPYFIDSLKSPDPARSVARHNTNLTHNDILEGASRLIADDGILQLILPYAEGGLFIAEAQEFGFYCSNVLKIKPMPSSEVRRMILTFSRKKSKAKERFLIIEKGKRHDFTEEYIKLTKDFYLNF